MKIISDLHSHSRFAGGCSKQITLDKLEQYAKIKGINLLGTGDFTHNSWYNEIKNKLKEDENGILWSKDKFPFIWQTEISLVFTQGGKGRRVHLLVLAPNGDVVNQINSEFGKRWRLDYDGRPIFGINAVEFTDLLLGISKDIEIIPAHILTSWYAIFGSKSGFDSVEECFEDRAKYIHALETGMSSTPEMDRRISKLDNYRFVSFSDLHSYWPWRIGREATIFDCELTHKSILNAIRTGEGLKGTIETPEQYGKYHFDGHRNCGIVLKPEESKKLNGICPKCKRELTIGVAYRVEELADRKEPINVPYFMKLIPLTELICAVYGINQLYSKKVWEVYNKLINSFNDEYNILLNVSLDELKKIVDERLADVIIKNREGNLKIDAGYDGVYGRIVLDKNEVVKERRVQKSLSEF